MSRLPSLRSLFVPWMVVIAGAIALAQTPGAGRGTLVVRMAVPAVVYVDGRLVAGDRGDHRIELPAGLHRLRIVHADYVDLRRVVDVGADQSRTIAIDLTARGVRKAPATRRTDARRPPTATDADLIKAIGFVGEGDFEPAAQTLEAVVRNLANVPRLVREQALAYLYLGVAYAELDQIPAAQKALAHAQQLDAVVAPRASEFSPHILRLWEEARTIDPEDGSTASDARPAAPASPPAADTPGPAPAPTPAPEASAPASAEPGADAAPAPETPDAEFIAETDAGLAFRFVLKADAPCPGVLTVERESRNVAWEPAPGCSSAFRVPAAELRSPAAGPFGGVLLQFRSDRPAMTLMPGPDADLLEPGVDAMHLNDLPPSTRVNLRRAIRELSVALGRRAGDSIFGLQVDLPLEELVANNADFEGASVRTRGTLDVARGNRYELKGETETVQLLPSPATSQLLQSKASQWKGQEMQISGVFSRVQRRTNRDAEDAPRFAVAVSSIEPTAAEYAGPARQVTVQDVTTNPPAAGELVRVTGRYRGANWFGDLPSDSRRAIDDWVIKDGAFAVWVTGRKADRDGLNVGGNPVRDSRLWVAVTGKVEERKGMVYLRARRIEAVPPPDTGGTVTGNFKSARPTPPADIAFLAPVAGIESASTDQQFLVRFTKPMDESTLRNRVQVRYADAPDTALPRTSVTYYAERTYSIMVDPGEALQPGRTVELVLLPGIKDADGQPLAASTDPRVLKWMVGRMQ
jgi:hypothetical protein